MKQTKVFGINVDGTLYELPGLYTDPITKDSLQKGLPCTNFPSLAQDNSMNRPDNLDQPVYSHEYQLGVLSSSWPDQSGCTCSQGKS